MTEKTKRKFNYADLNEDQLQERAAEFKKQIDQYDLDIAATQNSKNTATKELRAIIGRLNTISINKLAAEK